MQEGEIPNSETKMAPYSDTEVTKLPYGEARRLRYFVLISTEVLKSPSIDIDLFIDRFLKITDEIKGELPKYVRDTGIINSRGVARNYLRFAAWLNFMKLENRIVIPNSYTVFLANLDGSWDFFLTKKEKIAFLLKLTEVKDFVLLIASLKGSNSIKQSIELLGKSEHFIESYYEWLIDLGIIIPTRAKFGKFYLSSLGEKVVEAMKQRQDFHAVYAEMVLGAPISNNLEIPDNELWKALKKSLDKLGNYTRSEIDSGLYSVYPLLLDLQIQLVFEHHCLVRQPKLVERLNAISPNYNSVFSWDYLSNSGYLKLQR